MGNDSLSANQSGEGGIRKNIIEGDLVDCIVTLPGQLKGERTPRKGLLVFRDCAIMARL